MAMLSDRRRKQKISLNPQGTNWSNDNNKFGQKMLERMGWSQGKGLGVNEDGRVEHVKVKFKDNQKGIGSFKNYTDNWISHQDDFNNLLESLKESHVDATEADSCNPDTVVSLEKKSQSSKSRVHYSRFTRGKDLSLRSRSDLNCIFGKRVDKLSVDNTSSTVESQEQVNTEEDQVCQSQDFKTIKSSYTMQDYFAKKLSDRQNNSFHCFKSTTCDTNDTRATGKKKRRKKETGLRENEEKAGTVVLDVCAERDKTAAKIFDCSKLENKAPKRKESKNCVSMLTDDIAKCIEEEGDDKRKKKKKSRMHKMEETTEAQNGSFMENSAYDDEGTKRNIKRKKRKKEKLESKLEEERSCEEDTESVCLFEQVKYKTDSKSVTLWESETVEPVKKHCKVYLPSMVRKACDTFKGSNVATIKGYREKSVTKTQMLKRIESKHKLKY